MLVQSDWYRLDGQGNGVSRFLSDEQRSRMRIRCWSFLDEEDDVVRSFRSHDLYLFTKSGTFRFSTITNS